MQLGERGNLPEPHFAIEIIGIHASFIIGKLELILAAGTNKATP
jgi:hypothetical protein